MLIYGVWCNPTSFREEPMLIRYFATKEDAELYSDIANEDSDYCDYIHSVKEINVE